MTHTERIKYRHTDLYHSMSYWIRSADNQRRAFDMHLCNDHFDFKFYEANKDDQSFYNYLRSGYITRFGYIDSSCDVRFEFQFTPICKI